MLFRSNQSFTFPYGGVILGVCSVGLFYWSTKTKKRALSMESSIEYTHETIANAKEGEYCSLSGSIQPLRDGDYLTTKQGNKTVLYFSNIVEKVRITYNEQHTVNQKTRNPRVVTTTNTRTEENNLTPPTAKQVNFGLFDIVTKRNVEIICQPERFLSSLKPNKILIPNNQVNVTVNNSSVPTVGEVSRVVESLWEVEKHLPVEELREGDRPRLISTVFGVTKNIHDSMVITDEGTNFSNPFIFSFDTRNRLIANEKSTSKIIHYFGIALLLFAGVSAYFEINGVPKALKEDTTW